MPTTERTRLFFALWPDDGLRTAVHDALTALAGRERIKAKLVDPRRYHLTLLFLGDVTAAQAGAARAAAAAASVRGAPFDLTLDRFGYFHGARVLWAGAGESPPALTALWLQLRDAMQAAGVPHERRALAPHVTCVRGLHHPMSGPLGPLPWRVTEFTLVHSVPHPPDYRVLARWPLPEK